ncbi:glycoside hydrolase domain-containing protein [Lactococcus garvieae]|uniref:DUF1906 domain-containing protein n=1 Tax=Lactococcus garvieae TaxID=1363 RepID=A0AA46YTE9_9LACT|nr:glycoside hydrolase domain-containing protein [Lactococcus garvieae]UYT10436.1 DUF1906 domain-containing protein [Lactococcus garvieae]UYT12476.1 DUF1906 domain-containing protein [Lactococcus garvieae]
MADEMVLATQKWLNKTYGNIPEFDKCPENGKTGWPTIYSLIEGLQIELGIAHPSLSPIFGPTTSRLFDEKATPKLVDGYKSNIVYLIQGAFWCKGISPGAFDGVYSNYTRQAIIKLQGYAGFDPDGILSSMWAAALFDMSAFVLVPGGDSKVRLIQQNLNLVYHDYFGILPCDGIYQRETNTALIYALQAEEGMLPPGSKDPNGVGVANGVYGPGTTTKTPTLKLNDSGPIVGILQAGLYVNGFYQDGLLNNYFNEDVALAVEQFKEFMILKPVNNIANMPVMKGLLSSAGDTDRWATGADTAAQLTPAQIQTLVKEDVHIIGRYLTGTVGVGADKRDKFLTVEELTNLFNAGISVFPIYQDGGWDMNYFTAFQGASDANTASAAAINLGIPLGTVIYFAVDVDIQDGDIDGTVLSYFGTLAPILRSHGYRVGVYGTRNVCNCMIGAGFAELAFVSDMSTGFSGNLGFPMPRQWAFDQFIEFTIGSGSGAVGIDNDAVSGRDKGFSKLEDSDFIEIHAVLAGIGEVLPLLKDPAIGTISFNQEQKFRSGPYNVYVNLTETANINPGDGPEVIKISNGQIKTDILDKIKKYYGKLVLPIEQQKIDIYNALALKLQNGAIIVTSIKRTDEPEVGVKTVYKFTPKNKPNVSVEWAVEVYLNRDVVKETQPEDMSAYETLLKVSAKLVGADEDVNTIRFFDTHANMLYQNNYNYSQTIASGGVIATFGLRMLQIFTLLI